MSKKLFIKGTLLLTFAGLASRLIGFFYRIFLSHTIGAEGLGIFQLVMPLQILALAFCASGIQTAISRLTASREALGCPGRAGDYFISGTLFSVLFSLVLSFLFYYRADFWAVKILKEPRTASLIRMMAPAVPLSTLHTCINNYYFGRKKAGLPAGIQLLEQAFRVGGCYVIYLVCISEKRTVTPLMAAGGNLIGETAACIASLFFISMHFKEIHYSFFQLQKPLVLLKELFHISVPLSLNKILLTVLGSMEVILIPGRLQMSGLNASDALSIYGIFTEMALPLILFPATLTNSVAVMLLPSVTELQTLGYQKRIRYVIRQIFRYCVFLGGACMLLFLFFGKYMGIFLFHSTTAGTYIRTMSFICPFLYLNTTLTSVLNGLGRSGICLIHSAVSLCIRVAFVLFAIPIFGIRGYLYGILFSELILTVLHIIALSALGNLSEKH